MNVSFTGLKNIGAMRVDDWIDPKIHRDKLFMQLTNTGQHKDLDDFKELLDEFPNKDKSDSFDLEFNAAENGNYEIFLNSKPLYKFSKVSDDWKMKNQKLESQKWSILSKINGLLERISNSDEPMPLENAYLESDETFNKFKDEYLTLPGNYYTENIARNSEDLNQFINEVHDFKTSIIANDASIDLRANINEQIDNPKTFYRGVKNVGGFTLENEFHKRNRLVLEISDENFAEFGKSLGEFVEPATPKKFIMDRAFDKRTGEVNLAINGVGAKFNENDLTFLVKLAKLMTKIDESDKELSFPEYYLTDKSFDELSPGIGEGTIRGLYRGSEEAKKKAGIEFKLIETSDESKKMARLMAKSINRKIDTYLNQKDEN